MADAAQVWKRLCERLGVQPKQFATLLAVLTVAVGGLGIKFAAGGPRKAAASTTARAKTPAPAKEASKAPKAGASAGTSKKSAAPANRRVVEVEFDRDPSRDPFRPWGVPAATEAGPARVAAAPSSTEPGYLPGLTLKAVVPGELAVFGDQTVRAGDAVALPDGSFARVTGIRARTVTVDWNGRSLDVTFGSAPQPKTAAPGGFR